MDNILIVEDDRSIANGLCERLAQNGYRPDVSFDGVSGLAAGSSGRFSAVLLDLGLPQLDGLSVLKHWRREGLETPVIVFSARGSWMERVEGIDAGADDYLPKPFEFDELLARLRAVLRRARRYPAPRERVGRYTLDYTRRIIDCGRAEVELTVLEFRLFTHLAEHQGHVVKTSELIEHLYGAENERSVGVFDRLLGRLRQKVGSAAIETVRGKGYRLKPETMGQS